MSSNAWASMLVGRNENNVGLGSRVATNSAYRSAPVARRHDRQGFSIRVNAQWRICFVWRNNEAWDVEIVDYH